MNGEEGASEVVANQLGPVFETEQEVNGALDVSVATRCVAGGQLPVDGEEKLLTGGAVLEEPSDIDFAVREDVGGRLWRVLGGGDQLNLTGGAQQIHSLFRVVAKVGEQLPVGGEFPHPFLDFGDGLGRRRGAETQNGGRADVLGRLFGADLLAQKGAAVLRSEAQCHGAVLRPRVELGKRFIRQPDGLQHVQLGRQRSVGQKLGQQVLVSVTVRNILWVGRRSGGFQNLGD